MSIVGIISVLQAVTLGIAIAVVLGGVLSALVYLGYFEIRERSVLQRDRTKSFFGESWEKLISIDPLLKSPDAFRLHYRQLCGQLMTRVNEEAIVDKAPAPMTRLLASMFRRTIPPTAARTGAPSPANPPPSAAPSNPAPPFEISLPPVEPPTEPLEDRERLMNDALRTIDQLQLRLATEINHNVLATVFYVWAVIYFVILMLTWIFGDWPGHEVSISWVNTVIRFIFSPIAIAVTSVCVAAATAATAVVAFTLIDRVVSAR